MTPSRALLACLAVSSSFGCAGDGGSELEGVYTVASWTRTVDGCDGEPQESSPVGRASHFFVRRDEFLGETTVSAVTCDDLASCRTMAADRDTLYLGNFTFDGGGDADGWTGATIFLSGGCEGMVTLLELTGEPGASVRIQADEHAVSEVPVDGDGDCDFDAAVDQAEDAPCDQREVVSGTFLEAI